MFGWWWADPLAAIIVAVACVPEGLDAWGDWRDGVPVGLTELPDGSVADDAPELEGHGAVGDGVAPGRDRARRAARLRRAGRAHVEQQRRERLGLPLGEPARRLVEEQHPGLVREDARELDDAAHPGRELVDEAVGVVDEPELLEELVDARRGGAERSAWLGGPARTPPSRSRAP